MSNEEVSKNFNDVALEEMAYVYQRAEFSRPADQSTLEQRDQILETEFERTPKEVFDTLCSAGNFEGARTIALNKNLPPLNGLSLSGGGIRSASFCLGVVESLAEIGVLNQFHYVSSVSGGGYTAGWLGAWSYRLPDGIAGVQRTIREAAAKSSPPQEVQHLSQYVTYLAPSSGVLSADLWGLLSAYFRNLIITLGTILPIVMIAGSLPIFLALCIVIAGSNSLFIAYVSITCVFTIIGTGIGIRFLAEEDNDSRAIRNSDIATKLGLWGPMAGGVLFATSISNGGIINSYGDSGIYLSAWTLWGVAAIFILFAAALATKQIVLNYSKDKKSFLPKVRIRWQPSDARWRYCVWVPASLTFALVMLTLLELLIRFFVEALAPTTRLSAAFAAITFGPLAWSFAVFFGETFFQAVLSRELGDGNREWMARFGGLCLSSSLGWMILCLITLGIPTLSRATSAWWFLLFFGLAIVTAKFFFPSRFSAVTTSVAATVCLTAIGHGVFWSIQYGVKQELSPIALISFLAAIAFVLCFTAWFLNWCVNINRFSMHALYRDRLVRTFLGASRHTEQELGDRAFPEEQEKQFGKRKSSPFHDFDSNDNPLLNWLKSDSSWRPNHWMPIFLFNASLNRTWQTREPGRNAKSFSFSFSPFFCGSKDTNYCRTEEFVAKEGGFTLGAAMATSGAALSSRAGRFDNRLFAFFLTLVNLRLGTWLGSPDNKDTRVLAGPKSSWKAYYSELLGGSSRRKDWIHLSDGGHFENLGTYELIKRGCAKIIAIDSSADPDRNFSDLSNLIRLVREELNIVIEPASNMRIGDRDTAQGQYAAIFSINYPEGASGRLIYIKPALYNESTFTVPIEVNSYAKRSPAFPHEPTSDQFFSAEQFDAYRRLGQHQIRTIFAGPIGSLYNFGDLFDLADEHTKSRSSDSMTDATIDVLKKLGEIAKNSVDAATSEISSVTDGSV